MRLVGIVLVIACGIGWAWMLGAFSFINEWGSLQGDIAMWANPGVQPFFACASSIYGAVGAVLLLK